MARRSRTAQIRASLVPSGTGTAQASTVTGRRRPFLASRSPLSWADPRSRCRSSSDQVLVQKLRRPLGPSGRDCVTDGWHDFRSTANPALRSWLAAAVDAMNGMVRILPENEQDRRQAASGGDRHWRKEPRKGHQRSNLPSTGRDGVQSDDRTLGYTDEGNSVVKCLQPFPLQDVGDAPVRMDLAVRGRFMVFSRRWMTLISFAQGLRKTERLLIYWPQLRLRS